MQILLYLLTVIGLVLMTELFILDNLVDQEQEQMGEGADEMMEDA